MKIAFLNVAYRFDPNDMNLYTDLSDEIVWWLARRRFWIS